MHEYSPTLTIAVPTYNREQHLRCQLGCLLAEISMHSSRVQVLVSDNCSSDGTHAYLADIKAKVPAYWSFVHQPENLGLIGNIRFCINGSHSDYLWIVSDDDILKPGIVARILELIDTKRPGLLHLGWGIVSSDKLSIIAESFYGFNVMMQPAEGHNAFVQIVQAEHLGMSFITANVMNVELAKHGLSEWRGGAHNLAIPLFLSTVCSHCGGFYFEKKTWLYGRTGDVSWSAQADRFAFHDLPYAYQRLRRLGFSRRQILSKHLRLLVLSPRSLHHSLRHPVQGFNVWILLPFRLWLNF